LSALFLTSSPHSGIVLYHRDRKGQRGVPAEHGRLCSILGSASHQIANLLGFFNAYILRKASTDKVPLYIVGRSISTKNQRLAIGHPFELDVARPYGHQWQPPPPRTAPHGHHIRFEKVRPRPLMRSVLTCGELSFAAAGRRSRASCWPMPTPRSLPRPRIGTPLVGSRLGAAMQPQTTRMIAM
jgi:hypothetical protein